MKTLLLALTLLLSATRVFAQAAPDMIPLASVQVVNAPDVSGWASTAVISQVAITPNNTVFTFSKNVGPNAWPNVVPPGWEGPLQYTVWLFRKVNGAWVASAFIQMWQDRNGVGDAPSDYSVNWYYAQRWAPLYGSGPLVPGETIGFMLTSGNQRDNTGPNTVQERSNIVTLPTTDNGVFNFPSGPTPPSLCEDPKATNFGQPLPCTYAPPPSDLQAQVDALKVSVAALTQRVSDDEQVANTAIASFNTRIAALEARPVVTSCKASVFGIPVSCSVQ
jgi:hypothetical protein